MKETSQLARYPGWLVAREGFMVDGSALLLPPRKSIVLASGSPRRRELLEMMGLEFEAVVPDVDEVALPEGDAPSLVVELALRKALCVRKRFSGALIIGADTVVVLDGAVLGKPTDPPAAESMLRALSGRTHVVYTGVALVDAKTGLRETGFEKSLVDMKELTDREINEYVRTGEPTDKAGSYGIQGVGGVFIKHINGCFFNIMGLPVALLYDMMKRLSRRLEDGGEVLR